MRFLLTKLYATYRIVKQLPVLQTQWRFPSLGRVLLAQEPAMLDSKWLWPGNQRISSRWLS